MEHINLIIKEDSPLKGKELIDYLKSQDLEEDDPEYEILYHLEQNPDETKFYVSSDCSELLPESYPEIFE
jgi:hypothetical protein